MGKLLELQEQYGFKQSWLARRAGVHPTTLSKIMRGEAIPLLRSAQRIARALNEAYGLSLSVDDLWPLDD